MEEDEEQENEKEDEGHGEECGESKRIKPTTAHG